MALDGSYDGLKASVADFLNRGDLASAIPDFITLAEAQMTRRFAGRLRQGLPVPRRMIVRADAAIAAGSEYVPAPADFHGPIDFVLGDTLVLDYLDSTNLAQEKQLARVIGAPCWYALVGSELQLYPAADQDYAGELTYIARVPALSEASPANWILTDYPDAYLYGALVQSAPYGLQCRQRQCRLSEFGQSVQCRGSERGGAIQRERRQCRLAVQCQCRQCGITVQPGPEAFGRPVQCRAGSERPAKQLYKQTGA